MYEAQKGCCALCNEPEEKFAWLCIDHDHETGRIRGLLCPNCNRGLGLLKDNASLLQKAAAPSTPEPPPPSVEAKPKANSSYSNPKALLLKRARTAKKGSKGKK